MRVRISFGVDIEDVPDQASNLGHSALLELKNCVRSLDRSLEDVKDIEDDYSSVLSAIEKIRFKLTNVDAILADTSAILEGLQNYNNGEKNVSERRPAVDPSGDINE